jgi:GT2 family glycosyltransferase
MVCVLPFYDGDYEQLLNLLEWVKQLGGAKGHTALLVADGGMDWTKALRAVELAKESFASAELIASEMSVTGWPGGPNAMFLTAAKYQRNKSPWLWMETDAAPLNAAWMDLIAGEYALYGKPYMGHIYQCNQSGLPSRLMSGIGVYPASAYDLFGPWMEKNMATAFDVALAHEVLKQAAHTNLIHHFWGQQRMSPSFGPAGWKLEQIPSAAVVFHRCKDGTLLDSLRVKHGFKEPAQEKLFVWKNSMTWRPSAREDVSAVISVYCPEARNLNRCLECVLPQVAEVVVVSDTAGRIPKEALQDRRVRYIQKDESDIGYGRKANYGIRFTKKRCIWLLNDDVFPEKDCCDKLLQILSTDDTIGMVGHELRYPNGKLQHGGTRRVRGQIGFPHLDTGRMESSIREPVEMESVTGASVMIRHAAFYQAGEFPTDHYLYLEDSHLCLSMRKNGWKVFYTPHAKAEHLEHQSTANTPALQKHVAHSVQLFQSRWSDYFEKNKNNPGMGVFA